MDHFLNKYLYFFYFFIYFFQGFIGSIFSYPQKNKTHRVDGGETSLQKVCFHHRRNLHKGQMLRIFQLRTLRSRPFRSTSLFAGSHQESGCSFGGGLLRSKCLRPPEPSTPLGVITICG